MKLLSKIIILSVIILSLSKMKIIVKVNKFSDLNTSKICLNIRDKLKFLESEFNEMLYYSKDDSTYLNYSYYDSSYTAKKEGEFYFIFYKKVDETKKLSILMFDYFNIFGVKKFLYIKISKDDEFLESSCDNSRFELENFKE